MDKVGKAPWLKKIHDVDRRVFLIFKDLLDKNWVLQKCTKDFIFLPWRWRYGDPAPFLTVSDYGSADESSSKYRNISSDEKQHTTHHIPQL